ncbi:NAD(P)H-dependent dehydrogenase/reductase [Deferribacter autotrophicus]|uniref:NAD(P)H-dependent dehydrogenase/reductase n=1 Tax=Deferribacter autotrophicus TaxID=500465 RepID=A0A5A8F5X4_9BACT|nr:nitroreductase family protein [Deferribacter autotrophicus]KAA0259457.1 NAD(P)H-dependent dehydrogenase/reductase [Deferribacter autotrophicus]
MLELLRKRRSIRQFQDKKIESEKIEILKEAILRSPSSRGLTPWEFIFVDDKNILQKLSTAKTHGSSFIKNAPLAVVVIADTNKSDVCIEDCSIAAITLQYTAESLGLGSCWAQIRLREHNKEMSAEDYVKNILNIPENYMVECIIGIGYPAETKKGHTTSELHFNKIHWNSYGK